ncbi:hypothetical protein F5B18DRAFT_648180 [Nemania serpens]|nr:hypothetical protein F5B18DRAFT_648180 [Nemania serpens]
MASEIPAYHTRLEAKDEISMTAGRLCTTCRFIEVKPEAPVVTKIVQQEYIRATNIFRFAPHETRLFTLLDCHHEMERLASHYGIQTPRSFDIHQTGPDAARIIDEALAVMAENSRVFTRFDNRNKAYILAAFCATIDANQRAYQYIAAYPSRFDPDVQQYLKKIKVIVGDGDEDMEIFWIAENTGTHTTRRLEFLVERVATALVPVMVAWMMKSEEQMGTVDTCIFCSNDDE